MISINEYNERMALVAKFVKAFSVGDNNNMKMVQDKSRIASIVYKSNTEQSTTKDSICPMKLQAIIKAVNEQVNPNSSTASVTTAPAKKPVSKAMELKRPLLANGVKL
jgi:hypothetical protein